MHARSSIVIYRYTSRKKLNAFSVIRYALFFLIVVTVKVKLKLASQLCMIEGVCYVRNSSVTLIRKGTLNSVTFCQCVLSTIILWDSLLAEVSHDEAKWNDRRATSAGFRRVSYRAFACVSLTTSDVFVTCDTALRTGLNLSGSASGCWIWAHAKI